MTLPTATSFLLLKFNLSFTIFHFFLPLDTTKELVKNSYFMNPLHPIYPPLILDSNSILGIDFRLSAD